MDVITGATGLLGNALVRELLKRGRAVKVLVRQTSDIACFKDCKKIEMAYGDILDPASLLNAFMGAEYIYHLASEISIMPGSNRNLENINVTGTRNVIKACLSCKVKRLIYTSSINAFKNPPAKNTVIDESLPFDPFSSMGHYNRTKAKASIEVLDAARAGLDAIVVCPTGVIGPYDFKISNMGSLFLQYCSKRQKITIDGAFDFIDSRDAAIGHILAAQKGKSGQTYILSGQRMTIAELMSILEKITGIPAPKYRLPKWLAYSLGFITPVYYRLTKKKPVFTVYSVKTVRSSSFISHEKAARELGFAPRPVSQTIKDNIEWFRENNYI